MQVRIPTLLKKTKNLYQTWCLITQQFRKFLLGKYLAKNFYFLLISFLHIFKIVFIFMANYLCLLSWIAQVLNRKISQISVVIKLGFNQCYKNVTFENKNCLLSYLPLKSSENFQKSSLQASDSSLFFTVKLGKTLFLNRSADQVLTPSAVKQQVSASDQVVTRCMNPTILDIPNVRKLTFSLVCSQLVIGSWNIIE